MLTNIKLVPRLHRPLELNCEQQLEPAFYSSSPSSTTATEHPPLACPHGLCGPPCLEA